VTADAPTGAVEIIGLMPCSDRARQRGALPCSTELLPAGFRHGEDGSIRLRVLSEYTLEKMRLAGVTRSILVIRKGRWDIPDFYGRDAGEDMNLAYLVSDGSPGSLFALEHASSFAAGARIAFGSPDVLFGPVDAYARALEYMTDTGADAVLGLHRPRDGDLSNLVELDERGRVTRVWTNATEPKSDWRWTFAVWMPVFTDFLHTLRARGGWRERLVGDRHTEPRIGHVLSASLEDGLDLRCVAFPQDTYLDINTADGLRQTLDASRL
jgi:glucose-1-phosphate thymidylyltransferase